MVFLGWVPVDMIPCCRDPTERSTSENVQCYILIWIKDGKWKWKVAQSCPTRCDHMDYTVHGILQARILECVAFPFFRGSSQPSDWTQVSTLQADSLPAEPQGKPKNTCVGSLSLLQQIFLTQELNLGLLHCGQILYQLSYQGSPDYLD